MTTDSQFDDRFPSQRHQDLLDEMDKNTNESTGAMDMVKRDRFELLSAYLDGEVTAAERKQVEAWLAHDPLVQCLYARLLKLRQGLQTLPVPTQQPVETTVQQVMVRINRRSRLAWVLGGAAVAACVIGSVTGIIPSGDSKTLQLAQQRLEPKQTTPVVPAIQVSPLMVALNNPVIEIPKAAVASPEKPVEEGQRKQGEIPQDIN
ncbi:anti-sigma factor family protein [Fortiea contorta]|uniref:anti-sigma factor family protein n=1 Tax=Fortiea contorta TaxID=1892405 RepID=UPI00034B9422|nr:zf-HC2 domain-containing protein [Fortiea contorta]